MAWSRDTKRICTAAEWEALRQRTLKRDRYRCQMTGALLRSGRSDNSSTALRPAVIDHLIPHQGDPVLFMDPDNLWAVSADMHDTVCQAIELRHAEQPERIRAAKIAHRVIGLDGCRIPVDGRWVDQRYPETRLTMFWDDADARLMQRPSRGAMRTAEGSSGAMARPEWFRQSCVPLTVVCGPPGAGKSTYVRTHAKSRDLLICFDEIATAMFGCRGGDRTQGRLSLNQRLDVLRRRNDMIGALMRSSARTKWPAAWIILTEPNPKHREWWRATTGASIVVLATPESECLRRIEADDMKGDVRGTGARQAISEWWSAYAPAPGETTIAAH